MYLRYTDVAIDGITYKLPSITSILDLYSQYGFFGKDFIPKSEAAANIGKDAHAIIKRINEGERISSDEWFLLPDHVKNAVKAYLQWMKDFRYRSKFNEITLYSAKLGVAGHPDSAGYRKRFATVLDLKLYDPISIRTRMQVAMYDFMATEMNLFTVPCDLLMLTLDKFKGMYREYFISRMEANDLVAMFIKNKQEVGLI